MSKNQENLNEQLFSVINNDKGSIEDRLKKVKYLVYLGADVNAKFYGKSILSKAIEQNRGIELVDFLREKGANEWVIPKNEALKLGEDFWDDNEELKSLDEIKQLLKKGADIEASDNFCKTALMWAASRGKLDVVKFLIQNVTKKA